ncbi:MAG: FecR family protein [Draconibacterium sp.]
MISDQDKIYVDRFVHGQTNSDEEKKLYERCLEQPLLWDLIHDAETTMRNAGRTDIYLDQKWKEFESDYLNRKHGILSIWVKQGLKYAAILIAIILGYEGYAFFREKVFSPEKLQAFETYVPKGQKSEVLLPDGTRVILNADSRLKYYDDFSKDRKVYLEGEGYFVVTHNSDHPFTVETAYYNTKVLGTTFNVMAYPDLSTIETSLESGRVIIQKKSEKELIDIADLKPNQKLICNRANNSFQVVEWSAEDASCWRYNILVFENLALDEICAKLERYFDVTIKITDPELTSSKYQGKFKNNESLEDILDVIGQTTSIAYTIGNKNVVIYNRDKEENNRNSER